MSAVRIDSAVLRTASRQELIELVQAVLDEEGAAGVADVVSTLLAGGDS